MTSAKSIKGDAQDTFVRAMLHYPQNSRRLSSESRHPGHFENLLSGALQNAYHKVAEAASMAHSRFDDIVQVEGAFKRVLENDDHRRSFVPTPRCPRHFHHVVRIATGKANC